MQSITPLRWIEQAEARQVVADAMFGLRRGSMHPAKLRATIADRLSQALAWLQPVFSQDWTAVQLQPVRIRRDPPRRARFDDRW